MAIDTIFYGAGYYGKMMISYFKNREIGMPVAFCDSNKAKWGKKVSGIEIISLEEAVKRYVKFNIIITVSETYYDEIYNMLVGYIEEKGLKGFIEISEQHMDITENMYTMCRIDADSFFWQDIIDSNKMSKMKEYYEAKKERLLEVYEMLEDDNSKKTYKNVVEGRCYCDRNKFIEAYSRVHYFPREIVSLKKDEVFVDCGGYDGDTTLAFVETVKGRYEKIYFFEANTVSFNMAVERTKHLQNIELINKGVYSKNTTLYFRETDFDQSCYVSEEPISDIEIEVVKMDSVIKGRISFIKMDIEGSELEALKGAHKIIEKYKPTLAISIYHKDSDIFEIPLYIKNLNLGYKFYVGHHATTLYETVIYAIPQK